MPAASSPASRVLRRARYWPARARDPAPFDSATLQAGVYPELVERLGNAGPRAMTLRMLSIPFQNVRV